MVVISVPVISSLKQTTGLGAILLSCLFSKLQEPSSLWLKPRILFQGCVLYFCNVLSEIALVLVPFYYHAYLPSYRNRPLQDSNWTYFYELVCFILLTDNLN
jgi:hypothetical protein